MRVLIESVRESEGECAWECCDASDAEAWRATLILGDDVRSWAYKIRGDAEKAARDLLAGRVQPLSLKGMATTGARCAYLP